MGYNLNKIKEHISEYFLLYLLILAILAVIWAAIRPHPGTQLWW